LQHKITGMECASVEPGRLATGLLRRRSMFYETGETPERSRKRL
jgi:hypothetical protein